MSPRRILVILDNCHEADAIRLQFCLDTMRSAFADAHITLLINARAAAVFERVRPFDRLIASDLYQGRDAEGLRLRWRKATHFSKLLLRVGSGYDLAMTLGVGSTVLNVLARLAARRSVGFANRFPWLLSSHLGPYDPYSDVTAQHRRLLATLGVSASELGEATLRTAAEDRDVARLLDQKGIDGARSLVLLHPGSDWACQQWLVERWAALADAITANYGAQVAFTGISSEMEYIASIQNKMRAASVSFAGLTTLAQLEALIARATLMICVDSAAHDLALRTKTPLVVLAGPSDAERPPNGQTRRSVVNSMSLELKDRINRCKEPKDIFGGCHNYECPMAGLRPISVASVLDAVASCMVTTVPPLAVATGSALF